MKLPLLNGAQGPITRETIRTTSVLTLRVGVQAGTLLVIARMLGPAQFGLFAGVTSLAILLGMLGTFGTHLLLLGERAKDSSAGGRIAKWALPTTLISTALLFFIYLVAIKAMLPDHQLPLSVLATIGLSELVLQPLTVLLTVEHHAQGRTARSQLFQILPTVLRFIAALGIVTLHPSDPLVVFGFCYLAASVLTLMLVIALMPSPLPSPAQWHLPTRENLRASASYAVLNITAAGPSELDKTLAARWLPAADAGMYSAAARVLAAGILPVLAMMLAAMPRLFREGQNRSREALRLLRNLYGVGLVYGVCLASALWLVAPVFDWLFGPKYAGVSSAIRLLCLAVPGMTLRKVNGTVLMTLGKPWMRVLFELLGIVVLLLAAMILSTKSGISGMSIAVILSEWTMALIGGYLIHSHVTRRDSEKYK